MRKVEKAEVLMMKAVKVMMMTELSGDLAFSAFRSSSVITPPHSNSLGVRQQLTRSYIAAHAESGMSKSRMLFVLYMF